MIPFVLETSFDLAPAPASQVDGSGSTTLLETKCSNLWWGGGRRGGGGGPELGIIKLFKLLKALIVKFL